MGGKKGRGKFDKNPKVEETMEVDDRDIGRIIGKGGCNIRELQEGTGCRIHTPPPKEEGAPFEMRYILISGVADKVERCKEAISGVLMGYEPRDILAEMDGAVIMRNIDAMSMRHLSKIREKYEEEYNVEIILEAHVARIFAPDSNKVNANNAKEALEQAMEDVTVLGSTIIPVPAAIVNQVINDSALRQLQDQTGLETMVTKNDQGTGISLKGLTGAIEQAQEIIEQRCVGTNIQYLSVAPGLFSSMSDHDWQTLMSDLDSLMWNCGVQVSVERNSTQVDFKGDDSQVSHGKSEMQKILKYYFPEDCDIVTIPLAAVDFVAGQDDRELIRMQTGGAVVSLDRTNGTIWLCGQPRSTQMVRTRIKNSLERFSKENVKLYFKERNQGAAVIGTGGMRVREIQDKTGARVEVDMTNYKITISGKEQSVIDAKKQIKEIMDANTISFAGKKCYTCGGDHVTRDCPQADLVRKAGRW